MRSRIYPLWLLLLLLIAGGCSKSDAPAPNPGTGVPACTTNSGPATGSTVTAGSTITLSWTAATNAVSYTVYLGTTASPSTIVASGLAGTSTSYAVPATAGATYYWYVEPRNSAGAATGCVSKVTSFTATAGTVPPPIGFYVVGYFPSYRTLSDVPDVKFRMCNVVNYAFFTVNSTGTLSAPSAPAATPSAVITKAKANNARVLLAINDGAGDGKTNFRNMAGTPAGRTAFIASVMAAVRQYGFDGVDVDWEFPSTSDGTDLTFTALMKQLGDSLHAGQYLLSAAITAGKYAGSIRDAVRQEVFAYADFFNVMAYDDFSTTAPYKQHSDYSLATTCLNYWLTTRGMPKEKCVLGFPGYGRPSGITQSGTVLTYRDILSRGGSYLSDSAVVTNGGFTNYTIYYNGVTTVKKKAILAKQQAGGMMVWEKGQDAHDGSSLLKAACDTIGRAY